MMIVRVIFKHVNVQSMFTLFVRLLSMSPVCREEEAEEASRRSRRGRRRRTKRDGVLLLMWSKCFLSAFSSSLSLATEMPAGVYRVMRREEWKTLRCGERRPLRVTVTAKERESERERERESELTKTRVPTTRQHLSKCTMFVLSRCDSQRAAHELRHLQ